MMKDDITEIAHTLLGMMRELQNPGNGISKTHALKIVSELENAYFCLMRILIYEGVKIEE